jgi:hypothetical protein
MMLNATFNNISVISWQSVLQLVETAVPGENHQLAASHWKTLSPNVVLSTSHLSGIPTHNVSETKIFGVFLWHEWMTKAYHISHYIFITFDLSSTTPNWFKIVQFETVQHGTICLVRHQQTAKHIKWWWHVQGHGIAMPDLYIEHNIISEIFILFTDLGAYLYMTSKKHHIQNSNKNLF